MGVTGQRTVVPAPAPPPGWIAVEPVRRYIKLWHSLVLVREK